MLWLGSCAADAVGLQLHVLRHDLGNFLPTLPTPERIEDWLLTSLKEKLIKITAEVISPGIYVAVELAEVAISGNLFADIQQLRAELWPPPVASIV